MATYTRRNIHNPNEEVEESNNTTILHFMIYIPYQEDLRELRSRKPSYSDMFLFLISKYRERLKKLASHKRTSKKIYQMVCCDYEHVAVRVSHNVHQLLKDVSEMTGYSISHIIRLLIEWECYRRFDDKVYLLRVPLGEIDDQFVTTITEIRINHVFYRARELVNEEVDILCA
jgi:predicted DNA-binding protein